MQRLVCNAIGAILLGGVSLSAAAYDGFVTGNVNLRAGPDIDYPPITTIPVGEPVSIQGCVDGWEWCDVIYGGARGWVAGNYIQYEYNDQPVLLSGYGAAIGIPIVSFVIADYWGHYYRNRPFWVERDRWYARPYVHRAPPAAFRGPVRDYGHVHGYGGEHHAYGGELHGSEHVVNQGYAPHNGYGPAHNDYHAASHTEYHGAQQMQHAPNAGYQQVQHAPNAGYHNAQPTTHAAPVQQQQQHAAQHSDSHKGESHHDDHKHDDHGH